MLVTPYKNEQGIIDKVVLTSQSVEDANQLLGFMVQSHRVFGSAHLFGKPLPEDMSAFPRSKAGWKRQGDAVLNPETNTWEAA